MHLRELRLAQFRNYEHQELSFSPRVNVLLGENAQGKTNALEAIYLLAMGKSHRVQKDADLLRWDADEGRIDAVIEIQEHERRLALQFLKGGRRAYVNGIPQAKMTHFIGNMQVVLFAPEDLLLVKGSPSGRRRFLDMEIGQTYPKYLYHLSHYNRTMQQRNHVLKQGVTDDVYLSAFDEQLSEHGAEILIRRARFLEQIQTVSREIYRDIADGREEFELCYDCSLPGIELSTDLRTDTIRERFYQLLGSRRQSDLRTGSTSLGPHRDDLSFFLNNHNVQSFASQGQQRTIALSLRLAEIDFIYREVGEYPILLLDDVLSELDDARQRNLVLSMSKKVQTIITTTSLFHLEEELQGASKLFHVTSGIISSEG